MSDEEQDKHVIFLRCVADLANTTHQARKNAKAYALETKTTGTHLRFRRMRASAEASLYRFRTETGSCV